MKRNILTLVLAIVSSVWMVSEAGERWCMPTVRSLIQTWIRTEGIFQSASTPCEEGEVCPPCLTIVLETDDKTYYLVSESKEIVDLLENVTIGTHAIIEGQPFSSKGIDYICVSNCYVITEPIGQPTGLLGSWIAINENQEINNLIVDRDCDYTPNYSGLIKSNTDDACLRELLYNQIDNKLYISSLCGEYTSSTDSKNFTTTFSIVNDILTLDSYRYNDKTIRGLKFARNNSSSDNAEVLITGRWRVMNASDNIIYSFSTNGPFVGVGSLWMVQEDNQLKAFACYKIEPQEDGSYILAISDSWHDSNCINKYQLCKLTMDEMVWMQEENGEQHYTYLKHVDADDEYEQTTDTIPLPSLCDTWNVLVSDFMWPYADKTHIQHLANDTLIGGQRYTQLQSNRDGNFTYKGSLREGINRDIYYVPVNSTNEYLIYAFNAQEGDVLENVWLGGEQEQKDCTNAHNATVIEISNSNPRIFTLEIIPFTSYEGMEVYPYWMEWIEGVGMSDGPVGTYDSNKLCPSAADLGVFTLLCAYKNGEQVYVSEAGEKYGCEYNYNPYTTPTDTIPLYSRDDSGSSTVDPVDPNQIYATLTGDVLTVHNNTGAQVTFTLNNTSVNNVAARVRANTEPVSFTESISVELSEDGIYEILLTSEEWNYTVFGTVNYIRSGTDIIKEESPTTKKVLRGTQILIEREGKTYTLTGQEIK